ncbi:hypothetical protein [Rubritalea tangerina]|uniref:hypothetical protein n=1 Tax=Rubritalea tangerina TaxID=430798 RepID=UPI0036129F90
MNQGCSITGHLDLCSDVEDLTKRRKPKKLIWLIASKAESSGSLTQLLGLGIMFIKFTMMKLLSPEYTASGQ